MEETATTELVVRLDPRIAASRADLMARQEALAGLADLSKTIGEANRAMRTLNQRVTAIESELRDHGDAPDDLVQAVDSLQAQLEELGQEISTAGRDARLSGAIEGATARPTADQLWQVERAWERVPALIERLNGIITTTMPAINRQLDAAGIRPKPGEAIAIPVIVDGRVAAVFYGDNGIGGGPIGHTGDLERVVAAVAREMGRFRYRAAPNGE